MVRKETIEDDGGVVEESTKERLREVTTMLCPRCRRAMAVKMTRDARGRKVKRFSCPDCGTLIEEEEEKKGCFIATAAYGTPFAKEINVLRFWRDTSLNKNSFGRAFVKFYYTISPPIADIVSKSETLKTIVRISLSPIINFLKRKSA